MSRSVLITGATGFAGSHLLDLLRDGERPIHAWGNPHGRPVPNDQPNVRWSAVDLNDRRAASEAIDRAQPGIVYHCAGIADVHASWQFTARSLRGNALATHHLLEAARRLAHPPLVVVVSSALVYQHASHAITEESPLGPSSPYGVTKLAQEMLAAAGSVPVVIARPFNHAGPRQSDGYVTSAFARQIAEIEAELREPLLRVGNLESRRDITDVRDIVRGYRTLGERGITGRAYNICSGQAYRIRELMELMLSRARVPIRVEQDPARLRPSDIPIVLGSYERMQRETGWAPAIPIERTLDDLLDYWRDRIRTAGAIRA